MLEEDTQRIAAVIPIQFWTDQEQVKGTGDFINVDHAEWQKKGDPRTGGGGKVKTIERHQPEIWAALKPAYEAWKKGEDTPLNGTALDNWPPVTKGMVQHLKMQGLRTVEDLANVTDADLERIGVGARSLKEKAKVYLSLKGGDAKTAEIIADKDRQIAALTAQVQEALEAIKGLPVVEKKKGGRPPKAE